MNAIAVNCDYCGKPAALVTGAEIYPHRADLASKRFWRCDPCDAHVGVHPNSRKCVPLGRLANAELRAAKMAAHSIFDPLWRSREFTRKGAYKWLALRLGMDESRCHIGMMDVAACKAVIATMLDHHEDRR